jgi:hypothetical protein
MDLISRKRRGVIIIRVNDGSFLYNRQRSRITSYVWWRINGWRGIGVIKVDGVMCSRRRMLRVSRVVGPRLRLRRMWIGQNVIIVNNISRQKNFVINEVKKNNTLDSVFIA